MFLSVKQKTVKLTQTIKPSQFLRRDGVIDNADAKDTRTITVSFASEEPYERGFGIEILQVDNTALTMDRFANGLGCLLYNHNRDVVLGHIDKAWTDGGKAYASVTFDTDEMAETIYQKVVSGTLKGVSVGYVVREYAEVPAGETLSMASGTIVNGPAYVASNWEAMEISIVSVPADATVGVGRSEEMPMNVAIKQLEKKEGQTMDKEKNVAGNTDAVEAERRRAASIAELCRHFNVEAGEYIEKGLPLEEVQTKVLTRAAKTEPPTATVEVGTDEGDKYRDAATDALLMRAGIAVKKPAAGADALRALGMRSMMEDVLSREGVSNVHRMSEDEMVRAALTGTGALPGILSNVANKSMGKAYEDAPTTFQYFTSVGSNVDFKEASQYRLSEAGELEEVKENGEFKHDELTEGSAKKKVLTFGRSFTFTRQMIINDDLGALTRIPALYAAAAKRGINRLVYKELTSASNYSATNGNLAAVPAAVSLPSINSGRVAMRKQKNLRGEAMLNVVPKFLLVPAEQEFLARQMLSSTSDPDAKNSGVINPLMNSMQVVSDAELDAIDAKAWYLAADPSLMDTIEVTYLNGNQSPTIESQIAFDTLGIRYRIYMDYGVTVLDTKGLYKNAGK